MHTLYTGVSLSGKTTLARAMCRQLLSQGQDCLVFDPLGTATKGGDWGAAKVFSDPYLFLEECAKPSTVKKHLFIDEAHNILGHDHGENFWLLTEGRHFGLFLHLLTQRPKKLHPDVRSQCHTCYMFRLAKDDIKEIASDYGFDELHKEKLDKGDFLILNSGSAGYSRANVFTLVN